MAFERLALRLFLAIFGAVILVGAWQWRDGPPVSANLLELVPGEAPSPAEHEAVRRIEEPLNRELLVLIGHTDRDQAIALASDLQRAWADQPIFESVRWKFQPELAAVREQLVAGRLAYLPEADARLLTEDPARFVAERATELANPFGATSPVPTPDDWLGLTGRILRALPNPSAMQVDLSTGALVRENAGKTWVMVRARTRVDAFDLKVPEQAALLVEAARSQVAASGGTLLATGGMLYAAAAAAQALQETSLMGGLATVGCVLLLLLSFRRLRALLVMLPVMIGMVCGVVVCVAVFGKVHVLTLVVGMSLNGVAIDYAMHYLSKCFTLRPWNIQTALRAVLPGLTLSVVTSCLGYLALVLAPFPALRQIAVFSIAGLAGSYLCAVCLLPRLLARFTPPQRSGLLTMSRGLIRAQARWRPLRSYATFVLVLGVALGGVGLLNVQDDLRQWITPSQMLQTEARQIADITGYQPTSQFFMVTGATTDEVLRRQTALVERLSHAQAQGEIKGFLALSQLLRPIDQQQALAKAVTGLHRVEGVWTPLTTLGLPASALDTELKQLAALAPITAEQALAGPLGEPWRSLWMPPQAGQADYIGLVNLQGTANSQQLADWAAGLPGVTLVDRLGKLSEHFSAARMTASLLMGLACLIMGALLCRYFGWRVGLRILAVPVVAIVAMLGTLGYLGQPLTLFVLFGAILVLTIGVDYAIFMVESVAGRATTLAGVILDAATTLLSFGLLALSQTPAVRSFGLSVGLGILFCFLFAPWAGRHRPVAPHAGATASRSSFHSPDSPA